MSTSTPTQPSTTSSEALLTPSAQKSLISNLSLGALIVCPIIIALPPRKLDVYTVGLLIGTGLGANQVSREYTGMSITERFSNRMQRLASPLPPKALEMQERIKAEKEARTRREEGRLAMIAKGEEQKRLGTLAEAEKLMQQKKQEEETGSGMPKVLEKVWYGGEGKDWKAKRDQREKEALEEGRGYGGLIMDQIWEVWNWGQNKVEEVKEVDEKVVAEEKAKREGKK